MDHPRIDTERILDRYVIGDLPPDDEERFEEHLFECPACLEKVQWAEALRRGLRAAATEDIVRAAAVQHAAKRGFATWLTARRGQAAALMISVLAFGLVSATAVRQHQELQSLRDQEAVMNPAVVPTEAFNSPLSHFLVVSLGVVRGASTDDPGSSADRIVDLQASADRPVLLSLELPVVDAESYSVHLFDDQNQLLWQGVDLQPTLYDSLAIALPAGFLDVGRYLIRVESVAHEDGDSAKAPFQELGLQVLSAPDTQN